MDISLSARASAVPRNDVQKSAMYGDMVRLERMK